MTPLLDVTGVSVQFSGLRAVSELSFSAAAGEVRALIGPNGAGKTTVFNAITGYVPIAAGEILFRGEPIHALTPHEIAGKGVRRTFQNGGLFGDMTVLENVLTGLHSEVPSGFFGLAIGRRRAREIEAQAVGRARELLDLMDIGAIADMTVKDLPGGERRVAEIVRALATGSSMLLLDEPAVGLTPPVRDQLQTLIRRLAGERGIGILLIEHSVDMVMSVSDVIVVLNSGQRIAEGPPHEIRRNREVLEAYLGYG